MRNLRLIEAFVIALVIALLLLIACSRVDRPLRVHDQTECYLNLSRLYDSYYTFDLEHGAPLTQVSTNNGGTKEYVGQGDMAYTHFRKLVSRNVANDDVVVDWICCPRDTRKPASFARIFNTNVSYFLSANAPSEGNEWILMGNRNLVLTTESNAPTTSKWTWNAGQGLHGQTGFVMLLGGQILQIGDLKLNQVFHQAGNPTNSIIFP